MKISKKVSILFLAFFPMQPLLTNFHLQQIKNIGSQSETNEEVGLLINSYAIENDSDGQKLIKPVGINENDTIVFKTKDPLVPYDNGSSDIIVSEWQINSGTMYAFRFDAIIKDNDLVVSLGGVALSGFKNCVNLKSLIFSSGINTFGYNAFLGCSNLKNIYFDYKDDEGVTVILKSLDLSSTDPDLVFFFASGPSENNAIPEQNNFNNAIKAKKNNIGAGFAVTDDVANRIYTGPGINDLKITNSNTTINLTTNLEKSAILGHVSISTDNIHANNAEFSRNDYSITINNNLASEINPWIKKSNLFFADQATGNNSNPILPFGITWNNDPTSEEMELPSDLYINIKYRFVSPSNRILEVGVFNDYNNPISIKFHKDNAGVSLPIIIGASAGGVILLMLLIIIIVVIKRKHHN